MIQVGNSQVEAKKCLYGIAETGLQYLTPTRTAQLDTVGIV